MEEQAKQVAELFRLLANENRLLVLCALLDGPLTVAQLAECTPNISRPALSQHLAALRHAGLVADTKQGQFVVYCLSDERLRKLFDVVKREYCS